MIPARRYLDEVRYPIFTDPALSKTPSGSTSIESSASAAANPSKFLLFNASQIAFSFVSASGPVTTAAGVAAGLVVGLPLHTGGEEGVKATEARRYGAWLAVATGLPVVFWDERFTTSVADDALREAGVPHRKRRGRLDRIAAQVILQAYLEAGCPADGAPPPL